MDRISWLFGQRYELSLDGAGLLRYIKRSIFYHIHSNELTRKEKRIHRVLSRLKGQVRYY